MLLSTGFIIYASRSLGSADYGKYTLAFSLAGVLIIIAEMGTHTYLTKHIASDRASTSTLFSEFLLLKLILAGLFLTAYIITINSVSSFKSIASIAFAMGFFVFTSSIIESTNAVFRGYEKMGYESILMLFNRILVTGSGALALYLGVGLSGFIASIIAGNFISLITSLIILSRHFISFKVSKDLKKAREMFINSLPITIMLILTTLTLKSGIILLSFYNDYISLGLYGAPFRFFESTIVFSTFFAAALLPVFSQMHISKDHSLATWHRNSMRVIIILGLPLCILGYTSSQQIVMLLFGANYSGSVPVLQYFIWAVLLNTLNITMSYYLIAVDRQRINVIAYAACFIATIVFGFILIPLSGHSGAALSLLAGQGVLFVSYCALLAWTDKGINIITLSLKPALSACAMAYIISHLKTSGIELAFASGTVLYITLMILLREIKIKDILFIKSMFSNNMKLK